MTLNRLTIHEFATFLNFDEKLNAWLYSYNDKTYALHTKSNTLEVL